MPEYLEELRRKGPPKLRGDRSAAAVIGRRENRLKGGGVLQSLPAPGGGIFGNGGVTAWLSPAPPATGDVNVLALLVSFDDVGPSEAAGYFDDLVFGGAAPSMSHYYREVSGNALTVVTGNAPSTIGWLALPGTNADYQADLRAMLADAVAAADGLVDFSDYDNDGDGFVDYLIVVHVGTGWEWSGSNGDIRSQTLSVAPVETADNAPAAGGKVSIDTFMTVPEYWFAGEYGRMTIGVYAHEFGHLLGLPDLYDLYFDSKGIGDWGLMGYGMWNGPNNQAESPAWLSAWERVALGWATPEAPAADLAGVSLPPVEQGGPVYYLWNHGNANSEFFLIENRQRLAGTYDAFLPGHGLLVWHVDETMPGNNSQIYSSDAVLRQNDCNWPSHYQVALQQADGYMNLEGNINDGDIGDPYPGSLGITAFSPTSTVSPRYPPNSGSYATCASLVAIRSIREIGTDIVADLEVVGGNVPPVAVADSYDTGEDTVLEVEAPGVLGNDSDTDGDILAAVLVSGASHGELTLNPDGSFTYTPESDYSGDESFSYKVHDGYTYGNAVTVSLAVTPVNDAPVAAADGYTVAEGGTLGPTATGVLGNDTDADGDGLTAVKVTDPAHGTLTLNADGSFTYVHDGSETTSDSYSYVANDGAADSNVATVSITVTPVNDAPVAAADGYTAAEGGTLGPTATGVLGNDTDADGDGLTAVKVTDPAHGTLTLNADGSFTYVHDGSETTSDSFSYVANDGAADSNVATVSITVTPVNQAPILGPIGDRTVTEGKLLLFSVSAQDHDGDEVSFSADGLPAGAQIDPVTGEFSWMPGLYAAGTWLVSFRATDTGTPPLSSEELVTLTVLSPQGPVFSDSFESAATSQKEWALISGKWRWTPGTLSVVSLTARNLARIRRFDPMALPLGAGEIRATVTLTADAGPGGPNGLIVFGYRSATSHRWVKVTTTAIQIGQTGTFGGTAGVKRQVAVEQVVMKPATFTVKLYRNGLVRVYRGSATTPAASWRFPSVVYGGVGVGSLKARTVFDNVRVWEDSALGY